MNRTITLTDPPSSWSELSESQLIFIHSLPRLEMADSVFRMKVFLHLAGLELCGESFYAELPDEQSDNPTLEQINAQLSWMESVVEGSADITVVLKPVTYDGEAPLYSISVSDFFDAVTFYTKFIDEPYELLDCKFDTVRIGKHTYKAPDPCMASLTYEQYQSAQACLTEIWDCTNYIQQLQQQIESKEPNEELVQSAQQTADDLHKAQASFLTYVLHLMHAVSIEEEQYDSKGNLLTDNKGKPIIKSHAILQKKDFKSDDAERLFPEMLAEAPEWLFPVMYQWYQSCLAYLQKKFSKLFSGKKGGGDSDPLVSTSATLNTLMKEQGFTSHQDVLDANAIFIFQKLDALTRQAEEMERMNKKMKSKSHR